ncbi:MAG: Mut7-C RNAse domain-containing protein [Planctomycetota bacterium]
MGSTPTSGTRSRRESGNAALVETSRVDVPQRVRARCDRFWRCPKCGRTDWQGDHVDHMRGRFLRVSGDP